MPSKDLKITSSHGGEFDCYLALPEDSAKVPAIVLASAIHGVNGDLRAIADEFASHGYIAAAPDLLVALRDLQLVLLFLKCRRSYSLKLFTLL